VDALKAVRVVEIKDKAGLRNRLWDEILEETMPALAPDIPKWIIQNPFRSRI